MSTTSVSSGSLATGSTTLLRTGKATLNSIQLSGNGTNAPSVTVYDSLTATGKIIAQVNGAATDVFKDFCPAFAIRTDIGLCVVVAGTGATAIVGFDAT